MDADGGDRPRHEREEPGHQGIEPRPHQRAGTAGVERRHAEDADAAACADGLAHGCRHLAWRQRGAHRQALGRIAELYGGHVDGRTRFSQVAVADVRGDTDDGQPAAGGVGGAELDPPPDRVSTRPGAARDVLADDRHGKAPGTIGVGKGPAADDGHAQRREMPRSDRLEVERRVRRRRAGVLAFGGERGHGPPIGVVGHEVHRRDRGDPRMGLQAR